MKITRLVAPLITVAMVGCSSQSKPQQSLQFTATWVQTLPSGQITKDVTASGDRFKIVETSSGGQVVKIYDGQKLFQTGALGGQKGSADPANERSVSYLRFWNWTPEGASTTGESVLGRETMLYESKEPISNTTFRRFVDKETGILLKQQQLHPGPNINPQTDSIEECQKIVFGEVDPNVFSIP